MIKTPPSPLAINAANLRNIPGILDRMVALNNEHAVELSWAGPERMQYLIERACICDTIGALDALLLAMDQDADYDSTNFLWFRARYRSFLYVDRVVTAASARGLGYASVLYRRIIAQAKAAGCERIVLRGKFRSTQPSI